MIKKYEIDISTNEKLGCYRYNHVYFSHMIIVKKFEKNNYFQFNWFLNRQFISIDNRSIDTPLFLMPFHYDVTKLSLQCIDI